MTTRIFALPVVSPLATRAFAGSGGASWMVEARCGVFVHYPCRILLGYSIATKPRFAEPSRMTGEVQPECMKIESLRRQEKLQ